MRRVLAILPVLLAALAAPVAIADRRAAEPALRSLRSRAPGRVEAERSPARDRIRTLRGDLTAPSPEAPRAIAERFLSDNADLFGMKAGLPDLRLGRAQVTPGGRHFRFDQTYRGLPVFDRGADVHIAPDGRVVLAHNDYLPAIDVPIVPALSMAEAARAGLQDFLRTWRMATDKTGGFRGYAGEKPVLAREISPELGIFAGPVTPDAATPARPAPRLAYRLVIAAESPFGVVESMIDARTGAVLRSRSLVQDSHIVGHGQVFDPNPVNTLNDTGLRDNGDANDPALAAAYRTVELPGLSRSFFDLFGNVMLNGPYVRVSDLLERPYLAAPSSMTGNFLFTRDQIGFEGVMVYFHIDRSQRYIQSLGFTNVNNRPIRVDPHGLNGADNSHYIGFPFGMGRIAFGQGGVDDAEDADVVWHEYGHSIQDNTNPGAYSFLGEIGAQGEGFGDYWAFTNGPTGPGAFDPACIAEWDFNLSGCLRRVDGVKHYPEDIVHEVHADGEIWSSALHDIHLAVGRETTDRIVLQSHFLVPTFPRFCDGARALRDADDLLYAGAHRASIGTAMADRGIAGDLTVPDLQVTQPDLSNVRIVFTISNAGPCPVGPTVHSVHLVCSQSGDQGEIATVQTETLLAGDSTPASVLVPSRPETCVYSVQADSADDEAETNEENNTAESVPFTASGLIADFSVDPVPGDPAVHFERVSATGDQVVVDVLLRSTDPLGIDAYSLEIRFDPALVRLIAVGDDSTPFGPCGAGECAPLCIHTVVPNDPGDLLVGIAAPGSCPAVTIAGEVRLLRLTLAATAPGTSQLRFVTGSQSGDCAIFKSLVDLGVPCLDGNATIAAILGG